jgi:DOPA 4,5-dioxygenase
MYQSLGSEFPSPLEGFEHAEPLSEERNEDGKSFKNPLRDDRSQAYETFATPLDNGRRGGL